jgi:hypothetical protein
MNPPPDLRQRAIALIEQLPTEKLTAITPLLEMLANPTPPPHSSEESRLLETIHHQLPATQRDRITELRDRCEWGNLTEAEHQELIHYEDSLEQQNVERLAALMNLANLRNIDLRTLNHQLQSEASTLNVT